MKNWFFKQWWRVNKARNVISLFFWIAMFVGIWVPLVQIAVPVRKWVLVIVIGLFSLFFALLIGYVWDKLGLWREESHESIKRNITYTEPLEKERKHLVPLQLETAKTVLRLQEETQGKKNKKLEKRIRETEDWLEE